jgi:y4mF family transcriptional regulator
MSRAQTIVERYRDQLSPHRSNLASIKAPASGALIESPAALGDLVRLKRHDQRLSQQALADLAGVGRRFVIELEAGKPTVELGRTLRVCQALGLGVFADGGDE